MIPQNCSMLDISVKYLGSYISSNNTYSGLHKLPLYINNQLEFQSTFVFLLCLAGMHM